MKNYNWNFDLDTRPVHSLMSLSGLREPKNRIRYFAEDGSYIELKTLSDSLNTESLWIAKLKDFHEKNRTALFFTTEFRTVDRSEGRILDQTLSLPESFMELKEQLYSIFHIADVTFDPLLFIETEEPDGAVSVHILLALPLTEERDEEHIYKSIHPLCEAGGFSNHEYGLYPRSISSALSDTISGIHDGILIHETEYPWFQKKIRLLGNLQSIASLFIMITTVLFMNELLKIPFGWLLFAALIASGVFLFIKSRRNTSN